jgi:hypothetical protein
MLFLALEDLLEHQRRGHVPFLLSLLNDLFIRLRQNTLQLVEGMNGEDE